MHWYLEALRKYAVFSGRSQRMEFWMFGLFNLIILFLLIFGSATLLGDDLGAAIVGLYYLALVIPSIAINVRRLHDSDHSGW